MSNACNLAEPFLAALDEALTAPTAEPALWIGQPVSHTVHAFGLRVLGEPTGPGEAVERLEKDDVPPQWYRIGAQRRESVGGARTRGEGGMGRDDARPANVGLETGKEWVRAIVVLAFDKAHSVGWVSEVLGKKSRAAFRACFGLETLCSTACQQSPATICLVTHYFAHNATKTHTRGPQHSLGPLEHARRELSRLRNLVSTFFLLYT